MSRQEILDTYLDPEIDKYQNHSNVEGVISGNFDDFKTQIKTGIVPAIKNNLSDEDKKLFQQVSSQLNNKKKDIENLITFFQSNSIEGDKIFERPGS